MRRKYFLRSRVWVKLILYITIERIPAMQQLPTQKTPQKGLSGFALKYLAMALMVLDHIHYFFAFTGKIPVFFSMLLSYFNAGGSDCEKK